MGEFWRSLQVHPSVDLDIWFGASSSWGIALRVGNQYQSWELARGWNDEGRCIGWAESNTLNLAIHYKASTGAHDIRALAHSSNAAAIGRFLLGRGRNRSFNASVIPTDPPCRGRNFSMSPGHVTPKANRADAASCGLPPPEPVPLAPPVVIPADIDHLFEPGFLYYCRQPATRGASGLTNPVTPLSTICLPPSRSNVPPPHSTHPSIYQRRARGRMVFCLSPEALIRSGSSSAPVTRTMLQP